MKRVTLHCFFLLFYCFSVFGQNNLSKLVQKEFESQKLYKGGTNKKTSLIVRDLLIPDSSSIKAYKSSKLSSNRFFNFDETVAKQLISNQSKILSLQIVVNDQPLILDLINTSDRFKFTNIVTASGIAYDISNVKAVHYNGIVRGEAKSSVVSISVFENEINGLISYSTGNLVLSKHKTSQKHHIYNDKDISDDFKFECKSELNHEDHDDHDHVGHKSTSTTAVNNVVTIYYETEYDIFQNKGSIQNVINYITTIHNQVASIYLNEGIVTPISEIKVWDIEDDFIQFDNNNPRLYEILSKRLVYNGDIGMVLSASRGLGGGLAGLNGLCVEFGQDSQLGLANLHLEYEEGTLQTYTWDVEVITHELGHILGSNHTQRCVWNGNNTAIDGCATSENYGNITCPNGPLPNVDGGTIMSYCHGTGKPGVNFANGFGSQPGDLIRDKVYNTCRTKHDCKSEVDSYQENSFHTSNSIKSSANLDGFGIGRTRKMIRYMSNEVVLKDGFSVNSINESVFLATVQPCVSNNTTTSSKNYVYDFSDIYDNVQAIDLNVNTDSDKTFSLVPNPNNGVFTINLDNENKAVVLVSVFDITSKQVFTTQSNQSSIEINLLNLLSGLYIVKLQGENYNETVKFIKE